MSFDPATALLDVGKSIIERVWPDPTKQAQELFKLQELAQSGNIAELNARVQLLTGQMQVNAKEAEHKSLFVAGWRPGVGWICATALAYQFVLYPLMLWIWSITSIYIDIPAGVNPPPILDVDALYTVLLGMLGIGGMRSFDKMKGVSTNSLSKKQ